MKVKDGIEELKKCNPESTLIIGVNNGKVNTYGVVDHILENYYNKTIYNDLFGTPGKIDSRLVSKEINGESKKIVYLSSEFPYKHYIGSDDINYNIQSSFDDPNYLWKVNKFEWIYEEDGPYWSYKKEFTEPNNNGDFEYEMINYYKNKGEDWYTCELHCRRDINLPAKTITLINPGIEELINAMELIGIEKRLIV